MDNREVLTDLLESYKRYNSSRSGNSISDDQFRSEVEKICESYISTQSPDSRAEERRDQYISFMNEAAPIVEKNKAAGLWGILGGIVTGFASAFTIDRFVGGEEGLAGLLVGGAFGAVGVYEGVKYIIVNKPMARLIDDYTRRLNRLDEQSATNQE